MARKTLQTYKKENYSILGSNIKYSIKYMIQNYMENNANISNISRRIKDVEKRFLNAPNFLMSFGVSKMQ